MYNDKKLIQFINNGGDYLGFLKGLTKPERKDLLPTIKLLSEKYFKYQRIGSSNEWGYSNKQTYRDRLNHVGFICTETVTQFRENIGWHAEQIAIDDFIIEHILPWHKPKWYQRALNRPEIGQWTLDYKKLLLLTKKGYLKPSDQLIAIAFNRSACVKKGESKKPQDLLLTYEILENEPIALQEHFWLLFDQTSTINNKWRAPKENDWLLIIPDLIEKNMVDRQLVIEKSMLACTKAFDNSQTRWYYNLLKSLKLDSKEILENQNHLFTCLNSDSSSATKYALDSIKLIIKESSFDKSSFMDIASILLTSNTKSTVNSTLMLLEKIIVSDKSLKEEVTTIMIDCLAIPDEKIQSRVAKNIVKNLPKSEEYIELISNFDSEIFITNKHILKDFLTVQDIEEDNIIDFESSDKDIFTPEKAIVIPKTVDDIAFFLSGIFDNESPIDVIILPDVIHKLTQILTPKNGDKLSPAFNRALNFVSSFWSWGLQELEGRYINDFAIKFLKKHPNSLVNREKYLNNLRKEKTDRPEYHKTSTNKADASHGRQLIKQLYVHSLDLNEIGLTLLSTPTHKPGWLHPTTLIDRVLAYENINEPLFLLDWQVATNRLPLHFEIDELFSNKLNQIKNEKIKAVFQYAYLDQDISAYQIDGESINYFAPRIIAQHDLNGHKLINQYLRNSEDIIANHTWSYEIESYVDYNYDYLNKVSKNQTKERVRLYLSRYEGEEDIKNQQYPPKEKGIINSIINFVKNKKTGTRNQSESFAPFYGLMQFKMQNKRGYGAAYEWGFTTDSFPIFLAMIPNHYHLLLAQVIQGYLAYSNLPDEESKRIVRISAEILSETWHRKKEHELTYLFIACIKLCDNKITRETIAEWWCTYSSRDLIDQELLGKLIGILLSQKYAPLKRLTDTMKDFMFNLGPTHDRQLFILLSNIIAHMNSVPITNTKKLLEFFTELKLKYKLVLSMDVIARLEGWRSSKSLVPLINKLLK